MDPVRKNTLITSLLTCLGYAYFNIGDAAMKMVGIKFHFSQVIASNCVIIIAFMVVYGFMTGGKKSFYVRNKKWVMARAVLGTIVSIINVFSLPRITLATFYTLVFTAPFWVAVLSALFLGEKLNARRIGVIIAGFAVVLSIFSPGSEALNIYAFLVLIGAFFYAASIVIMRHVGPKESRPAMISVGSLLGLLLCLPFLAEHFIMPTPFEWGVFLIMGVLSAIGLLCIAYAFQNAPSAAAVAPYHYTQIVWGALLGYYIFGETPSAQIMIAAALIIAGGLYLVYSETRQRAVMGGLRGA